MSLTELFCDVDDFCLVMAKAASYKQVATSQKKPGPKSGLCQSEIMTLLIYFHQSRYRDFKSFYIGHVQVHLQAEFPGLVSYQRFVELMPTALAGLCSYLYSRMADATGIAFIDSTALPVCHNRRIRRNRVFADLAARGKTSMGWFYGSSTLLVNVGRYRRQGHVAGCGTPRAVRVGNRSEVELARLKSEF